MQLRSPLPSPHNSVALFAGRDLRDVLEQRTAAAVASIGRLSTWDDDAPTAENIAASFDVVVPAPRWRDGKVQFGSSADQRMTASWSWPVDGDAEILAFAPTTHLSSNPPHVSVAGSGIYAAVTEHILTAVRVEEVSTEAERWVTKNLANVAAEVSDWRPLHRRRIRDALRKRRELLERVLELEATA
jgi:hypothetical protein